MKNLLACAVLLAMILGCSKKDKPGENVTPEHELKKEDVMPHLKKSIYQIAEWYSVSGTDTTFLKNDPFYGPVMKQCFLMFHDENRISYYVGQGIINTVFLGAAQTFNVNMFYFRAIDLNFYWDEKEDNLILPWKNRGDDLHIMPKDVTLKMDKSEYRQLTTFDEAKVIRKSGSMSFHYDYQGKVYTMVLKQMWKYAETGQSHFFYCVVF